MFRCGSNLRTPVPVMMEAERYEGDILSLFNEEHASHSALQHDPRSIISIGTRIGQPLSTMTVASIVTKRMPTCQSQEDLRPDKQQTKPIDTAHLKQLFLSYVVFLVVDLLAWHNGTALLLL